MPDAPASLQAALSDRYRIERELGSGGMATVYLAHDLRHDRPVALKVLHPDLAQALGPERFQREIHVAARLQHPHILTVHDSGETAGHLWFTMPFIDGESLRDRLTRERQLPVQDALRIAREAADALDYAHRQGIVHRDVKPENILLTEGHALVADFGIARALGTPGDERLTMTGTSIGTAAYMSPEQAAGDRDIDPRSDIYSLAIVLYEMLAGTTPFAAATPQATIARRFTETPVPLRRLRDTVPAHVEHAVQEALARTAADRFPTARAFADALAVQGDSIATGAARPRDDGWSTGRPRDDGWSAARPRDDGWSTGRPRDDGDGETRAQSSLRAAQPRSNRVAAALILGLLIGGGALFAWTRASDTGPSAAEVRAASVEPGTVRIAVLPFENLGDSADAYFAEGVTEAVRGKLAAITGLEVIARSSSEEYVGTTKGPGQIADELGVDYLLTGRVRWVRQPDGTSRVQVSPELVEIADGTARTRWGQPFNAPLTDVFEVQGQIAGQVTDALDVELGASERQQLAQRPTTNLEAYDAWLQADAIPGSDPASMRRIASLLERAVQLDPRFGEAWARLAQTRSVLWATTTTKPSDAELREPMERAMALAPDGIETWRMRIGYAANVERDLAGAQALAEQAASRHPGDPELARMLGSALAQTGDMERAMPVLRRAAALDPRNARTMRIYGAAQLLTGEWAESRVPLRRALALAPDDYSTVQLLTTSWLYDGDLAGARRTVNSVAPTAGREGLLAYMAMYGDFWWVLDRPQQDTVLTLGVDYFDGDAGSRALAFAQILHQRGDTAAARRWADTAGEGLMALGDAVDQDPQIPGLIGLAHAYAGRHAEARRWLDRGVAESRENDPGVLPYAFELLARARLLAGDRDGALTALEQWVELEPKQAPGLARLHPQFAELRGDPRYERIVGDAEPR